MMRFLRILFVAALLVALLPLATSGQATNITCPGQPIAYRSQVTRASQGIACYKITMGRGNTSLKLDLKANSGAYDLYVKAGNATSFKVTDKVNSQLIKDSRSFVLRNARSSTYTVAVVRSGRSGTFDLTATTASRAPSCVQPRCITFAR